MRMMKTVPTILAALVTLILCWHHDLSTLLTNKAIVIRTAPTMVVDKDPEKPSSSSSDLKTGTIISTKGVHVYVGDEQLRALNDNHNNTFHGVKAKSFASWNENELLPCFPPRPLGKRKKNYTRGFLYLKPLKTASSTAAGVNLRLARNAAQRRNVSFATCEALYDHTLGYKSVPNRNKTKSFLWSTVRDPIDRHVSSFYYFHVTGMNLEPTFETFIDVFRNFVRKRTCSHYLERLATYKYQQGVSDPIEFANSIFDNYNFIGVTERMDESIVALAMLLRVPLADVLYLSSKTSGNFGMIDESCKFLPKTVITPAMQDFFQTQEFQECVKMDHIIHQVANRSLNLTIDRLGYSEFNRQLARFKEARKVAADRCSHNVRYPCDSRGQKQEPTDCLYKDSGCGYKCLDEVATELNLWQVTTE